MKSLIDSFTKFADYVESKENEYVSMFFLLFMPLTILISLLVFMCMILEAILK